MLDKYLFGMRAILSGLAAVLFVAELAFTTLMFTGPLGSPTTFEVGLVLFVAALVMLVALVWFASIRYWHYAIGRQEHYWHEREHLQATTHRGPAA